MGPRPHVVAAVQAAVASAAGILLFLLVMDRTGDRRAAWIATVLYAVSPYLIRQSVAFMEVTPAIVLLMLAAWRIREVDTAGAAAAVGAVLAALVLTRASFMPIAIGGLALLSYRSGLRLAAMGAGTTLAILLPWMTYNLSVGGSALPTRVGENLFVSTSEWTAAIVPQANVDLLMPLADERARAELARLGNDSPTELDVDRLMGTWAEEYVAVHPWSALWLKLKNLGYVMQPRLLPFTTRVGSATLDKGRLVIPPQASRPLPFELAAASFQAFLLIGGAAGLYLRRAQWREDGFLLIVAAGILATNVVFFPVTRRLAPMTFVLMFYTAVAITALREQASPEP